MTKGSWTENEALARFRNRHEDYILGQRLDVLNEDRRQRTDILRSESIQLREEQKQGQRSSGYCSGKAYNVHDIMADLRKRTKPWSYFSGFSSLDQKLKPVERRRRFSSVPPRPQTAPNRLTSSGPNFRSQSRGPSNTAGTAGEAPRQRPSFIRPQTTRLTRRSTVAPTTLSSRARSNHATRSLTFVGRSQCPAERSESVDTESDSSSSGVRFQAAEEVAPPGGGTGEEGTVAENEKTKAAEVMLSVDTNFTAQSTGAPQQALKCSSGSLENADNSVGDSIPSPDQNLIRSPSGNVKTSEKETRVRLNSTSGSDISPAFPPAELPDNLALSAAELEKRSLALRAVAYIPLKRRHRPEYRNILGRFSMKSRQMLENLPLISPELQEECRVKVVFPKSAKKKLMENLMQENAEKIQAESKMTVDDQELQVKVKKFLANVTEVNEREKSMYNFRGTTV